MSQIVQLELNLWDTLDSAALAPEDADLQQLWEILLAAIAPLNTHDQLHVAAAAIARIAQLVGDRSLITFEELMADFSDEGPVMPKDAFDRYVRQTMQVDFDQFIEPLPSPPRQPSERQYSRMFPKDGRSVVGILEKSDLLEALEQQQQEFDEAQDYAKALETAHAEDVSVWVGTLADYIKQQSSEAVCLTQLQQALPMSLIEIWLGLLLGGYSLYAASATPQRGKCDCQEAAADEDYFYTAEIWVDCLTFDAKPWMKHG